MPGLTSDNWHTLDEKAAKLMMGKGFFMQSKED